MKDKELNLESILEKAASYSKEIEKLQSLSSSIKEEKNNLNKKESSFEKDLFSLAESLHEFQ